MVNLTKVDFVVEIIFVENLIARFIFIEKGPVDGDVLVSGKITNNFMDFGKV